MNLHFCYELDQGQKAQWEQFWYKCQHSHPRQHFLFGEVERAKGRIPVYAFGEINGSIVCIGVFSIRPLFFGNKFSLEAICLRGPAFDDVTQGREFLLQVISRFKTLSVGSIRISPYWIFPEANEVVSAIAALGFLTYGSSSGDRTSTGLVDIQRREDEILRSFSRSARYQIYLASRLSVSVRPVTNFDDAVVAFKCLEQMRTERGILPLSYEEFKATFEHVLKDSEYGILLNSFIGDTFLGGLWIIRGIRTANPAGYAVQRSISKELPSSLSIGPSLWWEGIKWAKEKGCSLFDVEGYDEGVDKSSPLYHIHEFKRKFCPKPTQIISQHVYVCNTLTYSVYKGFNLFLRGCNFVKRLPYQLKNRSVLQFRKGGSKQKSE